MPPPTKPPATLADVPVGRRARVVRVEGDRALRVRLWEMGLSAGTEVDVLKRAPMGDPLELRLRGYHLSLRRAEAGRVWVVPVEGGGA